MRRRLTIAILGVVLGTLVLTVAASVLLVQGAAISTSEGQLTPEAQALARIVSSYAAVTIERVDKDLQQAGGLDVLSVVSVTPQGNFSSVPPSLQASVMNPHALLTGETVTGNVGHEVFVAVPLTLARARKARTRGSGIRSSGARRGANSEEPGQRRRLLRIGGRSGAAR